MSCSAHSSYLSLRLLIQLGSDVDSRDFDGWTPLHGAAHWGQEEACRLLSEALCDMEAVSKVVRGSAVSSHYTPTAFSSVIAASVHLCSMHPMCVRSRCLSGCVCHVFLGLLLCMLFSIFHLLLHYCEPLLPYFSFLTVQKKTCLSCLCHLL